MMRLFLVWLLCLPFLVSAAAGDLPARPQPFTFVTDQASLLAPADAKRLDAGLRHYAEQHGTQVVVLTVPSLGGQSVADYARAIGNSWGVGQRGKNNGVVVLLAGQERQVSIQAGGGLQNIITPAVVGQVINQQMTPRFKQGDYFGGLRTGLNTLMGAADGATPTPVAAGSEAFPALNTPGATPTAPAATTEAPAAPDYSPAASNSSVADAQPEPSGPGFGTIIMGVLIVGGIGWLLLRLFRRKSAAPSGGNTPDFYGNQASRGYGNPGAYGGPVNQGSGGSGIGGILATGAAAAAGAYLGNRMASGGSEASDHAQRFGDADTGAGMEAGAVADDYRNTGDNSGTDYFSDANTANDYFSDDSSFNDSSSADTGGGGFDSGSDNSGSW